MSEFKPPTSVQNNAARALELIKQGKAGGGFQPATAARARKIAAGKPLTLEHVKRMHSFFSRHKGGRSKTAPSGKVTPWDTAWLAWGGDSGANWARSISERNKT